MNRGAVVRVGAERIGRVLLVCAIAAVAAFGVCSSQQDVDLTGTYAAKGYFCPTGVPHDETVKVVQTGSHVIATKLVGDDCVKAGHVTFEGDLTGRHGQVRFWASVPDVEPSLGSQPLPLSVVDDDHFTTQWGSTTMMFTKTSSGGETWIWLALVLLIVAVGAVLVVVLRRRRRRRGIHASRPALPTV